jgi:hypothetical protein
MLAIWPPASATVPFTSFAYIKKPTRQRVDRDFNSHFVYTLFVSPIVFTNRSFYIANRNVGSYG